VGYTVLISTHDLTSITTFCDQVVLINRTILAYGETSEVFTEENLARTFDVKDEKEIGLSGTKR